MKSPLSSTSGSNSSFPFLLQVLIGVSLVALGYSIYSTRITYFYVFLAGLLVIPLLYSRFSVHLLPVLLFLEVVLYGVFGRGTYTVYGLRAGYFDIFILVSTLVLFFRFRERLNLKLLVPFGIYLLLFLFSVLFKPEVIKSGLYYWQQFAVENLLILLIAMLVIDSKEKAQMVFGTVTFLLSLVALYFFYRYWQIGHISFTGGETATESLTSAFPLSPVFSNKNNMAATILPVVVMLSVFAFESKSMLARIGSGAIATMAFIVILSSASRGALVSTVGGIGFYLLIRIRSRRLSLLPLVLIGTTLVVLTMQTEMGQKMFDRVFSTERQEVVLFEDVNRLSLIPTSAALIGQHPFLGIGFHELIFSRENEKYNTTSVVWAHPHNSYLYLWVFGGTLTFMALLWAGFRVWRPVWRATRNFRDPMLTALTAAIIGMLLDFGTARTFFIGPVSHVFFVLFSSAYVYSTMLNDESNKDTRLSGDSS